MKKLTLIVCLLCSQFLIGQEVEQALQLLEAQKSKINEQIAAIDKDIVDLKMERIITKLKAVGLPTEEYIEHSAMMLSYSEKHEQANWVAHMIVPEVLSSFISRTNDFRVDPKVSSGTAVEEDYFLTELLEDSIYAYDGFGYDRGHLAPSADFRWSATAISESYYYSNISPQLDDLNRKKWGDLEGHLRGYLYAHPENELYVITLPLLSENLPVIERGINKVSIPEAFIKVALDLKEKKGIAFKMDNALLSYPLSSYAITIDEAEILSGYDFFNALSEEDQSQFESELDLGHFFPDFVTGNVKPLDAVTMEKGYFNTVQAKAYTNSREKITVCGTVVGGRYSRKENAMLQIDQQYPNEIFTIFIPKDKVINFPYDPVLTLKGDQYCFTGKIDNYMGHPSMKVESAKALKLYDKKGN